MGLGLCPFDSATFVIETSPSSNLAVCCAALTVDLVISMDDKYLYITNWFHGDVRQYDITDTRNPRLVGQVRNLSAVLLFVQLITKTKTYHVHVIQLVFKIFLGGKICKDSDIKVIEDKELKVSESIFSNLLLYMTRPTTRNQFSLDCKKQRVVAHRSNQTLYT